VNFIGKKSLTNRPYI